MVKNKQIKIKVEVIGNRFEYVDKGERVTVFDLYFALWEALYKTWIIDWLILICNQNKGTLNLIA